MITSKQFCTIFACFQASAYVVSLILHFSKNIIVETFHVTLHEINTTIRLCACVRACPGSLQREPHAARADVPGEAVPELLHRGLLAENDQKTL